MGSFRVGAPFGVEVRLHWTTLLLIGVVVVASSLGGGLAAGLAALLTIGVVAGSVTLHELGHIFAAAGFGIRTGGVTLYPFGGVASLSRPARSATEEVVVALAGPAVNVVLAALAALPIALFGAVQPFVTLLAVNVGLALFNLIPAYPMDGGRVLRGGLWSWLGELRATRIAARAGQAMAGLFAIAGLIGNPMLLVIGVVVFGQASAELARLGPARRRSEGAPAQEVAWLRPAPRDPIPSPDQPPAIGARWLRAFAVAPEPGELRGALVEEWLLPDGRVVRRWTT